MFPDYLDGAKVLEYTSKGHYGFFTDYDENDTPIEKEICYYAVAQWPGDPNGFYVFTCDDQCQPLIDGYLDTVEQCKNCHDLPAGTVWHKK